jgi:hypothetical protein
MYMAMEIINSWSNYCGTCTPVYGTKGVAAATNQPVCVIHISPAPICDGDDDIHHHQ